MRGSEKVTIGKALSWAVCLACLGSQAQAAQYTAFSLKVAQQRIEKAGVGDPDTIGKGWRQKEPEVVSLAKINRVEGFVYDKANGDLILVGDHEEGRAALTLDDLVVALRARFRYSQWPLVSIDPTPDTKTTQMQHVRFEGGIDETAFGQAMFEADYRLKQMAMGLEPPGIPNLETNWERSVKEADSGTGGGQREVNSRFWFYPINPHVVVREGVCVVRGLKVGVFTEVLAAKIDGKAVEDVKTFKDVNCDAFANDVSAAFDRLCPAQPSFNRLRGLQELVAVSKALEELDEKPNLSWWLEKYTLAKVETPKETKVLRRDYKGQGGSFWVQGGVHLTALAMRLNAGDVRALREAVVKMRPAMESLKWEFVAGEWLISLETGQVRTEDIVPLFAHALFLQEQRRDEDAITLCDRILRLAPNAAMVYGARGVAYREKGDSARAIVDFNKAISLDPKLAEAYRQRGFTYAHDKHAFDQAIADFDRAIELNPTLAVAYDNRGTAYVGKGLYDRAIDDLDRALQLGETLAGAYHNRGLAWEGKHEYDRAIADYTKAIEMDPMLIQAYFSRGVSWHLKGDDQQALRDWEHGLLLDPTHSDMKHNYVLACYERAMVLRDAGKYAEASGLFQKVIEHQMDGTIADAARRELLTLLQRAALDPGNQQ